MSKGQEYKMQQGDLVFVLLTCFASILTASCQSVHDAPATALSITQSVKHDTGHLRTRGSQGLDFVAKKRSRSVLSVPCQSGWTGPECAACTTDEACRGGVAGNATCFVGTVYQRRSRYKAYNCLGASGTFKNISLVCRTSAEAMPLVPLGWKSAVMGQSELAPSSCTMYAEFAANAGIFLRCMMSGCVFPEGFRDFSCLTVQCQCDAGRTCPGVAGAILSRVTGNMKVTGDKGPDQFILQMDGLPTAMRFTCHAGECVIPGDPSADSRGNATQTSANTTTRSEGLGPTALVGATRAPGESRANNASQPVPAPRGGHSMSPKAHGASWPLLPIVAAIPSLVITTLVILVSIYTWWQRGLWTTTTDRLLNSNDALPHLAGVNVLAATGEGREEVCQKTSVTISTSSLVSSSSTERGRMKFGGDASPMIPRPDGDGDAQLDAVGDSDRDKDTGVSPERLVQEQLPVSQPAPGGVPDLLFLGVSCRVRNKATGPCGVQAMTGWLTGTDETADPEVMASEESLVLEDGSVVVADDAMDHVLHSLQQEDGGYMRILSGASGFCYRGEVLGVLGPSGSGKSTLLGVLSHTHLDLSKDAIVQGHVAVGGRIVAACPPGTVGFVAQRDLLVPTLTVAECLVYSSVLRTSHQDRQHGGISGNVLPVLRELRLTHVKDSLVGGGLGIRGLSGGERRRVSIGMELVTKPEVLLMDEPTSGLDSHTATRLLGTCRQVAGGGRVVVLSLHQPSPDMFACLDRVILMARGHTIFLGTPEEGRTFCQGPSLLPAVDLPVAEQLLYVASHKGMVVKMLTGEKCCVQAVDEQVQQLMRSHDLRAAGKSWGSSTTPTQVRHLLRPMAVLLWQSGLRMWRRPSTVLIHWGLALVAGLMVGLLLPQQDATFPGLQNRAGAFSFALYFFAFSCVPATSQITTSKALLRKECRSHYYSSSDYLVVYLLLDALVMRTVPVVLFAAGFYPLVGMDPEPHKVAVFIFTLSTFACTIGALAALVAALSRSEGRASISLITLLLFWLLVGGFLVNTSGVPSWISWVRYTSPFVYAGEALFVNEARGNTYQIELQGSSWTTTGEEVAATLGMRPVRLPWDVVVLQGMYLLCVVAAMAAFRGMFRSGVKYKQGVPQLSKSE